MDRYTSLFRELSRTCPALELRAEEPMSRHTTFRIGGPVRLMALPRSEEEAVKAVQNEEKEIPLPVNGEYIDSSWGLSFSEIDLIRELYNDNQEDASSEKGFKHGQGTESQSNCT